MIAEQVFCTKSTGFGFALPQWVSPAGLYRNTFVSLYRPAGYFKATGRFFPADRFRLADQAYGQQRHPLGAVEWARHDQGTRFHHRAHGLPQFGARPFEQAGAAGHLQVTHFARQQLNPVAVPHSATVDFSNDALKDALRFDVEALLASSRSTPLPIPINFWTKLLTKACPFPTQRGRRATSRLQAAAFA